MSGLPSFLLVPLLMLKRDPTSHMAEEHINRGRERSPTQENCARKSTFEPGDIDGSLSQRGRSMNEQNDRMKERQRRFRNV